MYLLCRKCQYSATRALMIFLLPVTTSNSLLDQFKVDTNNWNERCRQPAPRTWTATEKPSE